jgi:hypothetical protein
MKQYRDKLQLRTPRGQGIVPPIEAFPPTGRSNPDRWIFIGSIIATILILLLAACERWMGGPV